MTWESRDPLSTFCMAAGVLVNDCRERSPADAAKWKRIDELVAAGMVPKVDVTFWEEGRQVQVRGFLVNAEGTEIVQLFEIRAEPKAKGPGA
jgi:hypothetical protein